MLYAANSSVRASKPRHVIAHTVPEMHESNIKALKTAYRHPFEYISPVLYRKNYDNAAPSLTTANLYVENEDEFHSQMEQGATPVDEARHRSASVQGAPGLPSGRPAARSVGLSVSQKF